MDKNKVSIIIPVYNVEKYIVQCLESMLAQTFADFEIIIKEDDLLDSLNQLRISPKISGFCAILAAATPATPPAPIRRTFLLILLFLSKSMN